MSKPLKQTLIFPINIEPCEEGGFFANCPILQGCHAEGETYGEAIDNISDVIKAHIKIKIERLIKITQNIFLFLDISQIFYCFFNLPLLNGLPACNATHSIAGEAFDGSSCRCAINLIHYIKIS